MTERPEEPTAVEYCRALLTVAERKARGRRGVAWRAAALGFLTGVAVGLLASGIVG